ncbi:OsmC/Ohr family [Obelidium mucronatum]|nr:OsmC/Ohr family [Obelidium mucronatum]
MTSGPLLFLQALRGLRHVDCHGLNFRSLGTKAAHKVVDPFMKSPSFDGSRTTTGIQVQWMPTSKYQFAGTDPTHCEASTSSVLLSLSENEEGMSPMNLLLIALGGCAGMNIKLILDKRGVIVEDVAVAVTGQRKKEGFKNMEGIEPWESIHAEFKVVVRRGLDVDEEVVRKVVDDSVNKYCGVHKTLAGGVSRMTWGYTLTE